MIWKYVALYNNSKKLRMMILYRVDKYGNINNLIDLFAPKEKIGVLESCVKELDLMPFEDVGISYFEDKIIKANANIDNDDIIINGDLVTKIENKTQVKNRIIEQNGKTLVRKLVRLNG